MTAAVARSNVFESIEVLGMLTSRVAIVGATGSVGGPLADDGLELVLVGRTAERVARALPDLKGRVQFNGDLATVGDADVVVLLTSDPSACLAPALEMARRMERVAARHGVQPRPLGLARAEPVLVDSPA
jgi:predicted amino acid dehydrogenase